MTHFFVDRPIFASVLSIVVVLVGYIAYATLPVAQYPEIAPPTIVVRASYPGANAETVAETVATPIEQEINGVENMLYMSSYSTSDGNMSLTITFKLGTNLDTANVLVQNRVSVAQPRLPVEVRNLGVTTRKSSPDLMMVVHMLSPDESYDQLYISNYALLRVRDQLLRLSGVGDITVFGVREYSLRIWLDPNKLAAYQLSTGDVVAALQEQNVQIAGGALGAPPAPANQAFQLIVQTQGRFSDVRQFRQVIVKSAEGRLVRLRGRGHRRAWRARLRHELVPQRQACRRPRHLPAPRHERPSGRRGGGREDERDQAGFPERRRLHDRLQPDRVHRRVRARGLQDAVRGVSPRRHRRPRLPAILAHGPDPDRRHPGLADRHFRGDDRLRFLDQQPDPVRPRARHRHRGRRRHRGGRERRAQHRARAFAAGGRAHDHGRGRQRRRRDRAGAVGGVHPDRLHPRHHRASSTGSSRSPSRPRRSSRPSTRSPYRRRCARCCSSRTTPTRRGSFLARFGNWLARGFNRGFDATSHGYSRVVHALVARKIPLFGMLLVYLGLGGGTVWIAQRVPTGFIPAQDLGYLITVVQLPDGASLTRTDDVVRRATAILLDTPGVANAVAIGGFSGATFTNATNAAVLFAPLQPVRGAREARPRVRRDRRRHCTAGCRRSRRRSSSPSRRRPCGASAMRAASRCRSRTAPALGLRPLLAASRRGDRRRRTSDPNLSRVFTTFGANTPQIYLEIDRTKARMLNVPLANVFNTLQVNLGGAYVNDFNVFGRIYQVRAQADRELPRRPPGHRCGSRCAAPRARWFRWARWSRSLTRPGPDLVQRYNMYPSVADPGRRGARNLLGHGARHHGAARRRRCRQDFSFEWTELAYQERATGNTAIYIFALSVLFVFLVLAAQYESWALPLAIILIVPMSVLSALIGVLLRGQDNNILTQIGLVVLIGLAAKNAILIVEFAKQAEEAGKDPVEAVVEACRLRLRPILMTAFAFILGVVPLVIATGPGAEMRQALGTAVFAGMLGVTFFGLFLTPVFYVAIRSLVLRLRRRKTPPGPVQAASPHAAAAE